MFLIPIFAATVGIIESNERRKEIRREHERMRRKKAELEREKNQFKLNQQKTFRTYLATLTADLQKKKKIRSDKNGELDKLQQQIKEVQNKLKFDFTAERTSNARIIVMLGHTGHGKSTFANRLMGDNSAFGDQGPFIVGHTSKPGSESVSKNIYDSKLCVVDTPGYYDSSGKDSQHVNQICDYLKGCGGINGFLLVRNSTDLRFDGPYKNLLTEYAKTFGKEFFKNLIIVASYVDNNNNLFMERNRATEMQQNIITNFGVNKDDCPLPVLPTGYNNYSNVIHKVPQHISAKKFRCDQIISPLDILLKKKKDLREVIRIADGDIKKISVNIKKATKNKILPQTPRL